MSPSRSSVRRRPTGDNVAVRSLTAAQSSVGRIQGNLRIAESASPGLDLSAAWRAIEDLSLVVDAELANAEDRVSNLGR